MLKRFDAWGDRTQAAHPVPWAIGVGLVAVLCATPLSLALGDGWPWFLLSMLFIGVTVGQILANRRRQRRRG